MRGALSVCSCRQLVVVYVRKYVPHAPCSDDLIRMTTRCLHSLPVSRRSCFMYPRVGPAERGLPSTSCFCNFTMPSYPILVEARETHIAYLRSSSTSRHHRDTRASMRSHDSHGRRPGRVLSRRVQPFSEGRNRRRHEARLHARRLPHSSPIPIFRKGCLPRPLGVGASVALDARRPRPVSGITRRLSVHRVEKNDNSLPRVGRMGFGT